MPVTAYEFGLSKTAVAAPQIISRLASYPGRFFRAIPRALGFGTKAVPAVADDVTRVVATRMTPAAQAAQAAAPYVARTAAVPGTVAAMPVTGFAGKAKNLAGGPFERAVDWAASRTGQWLATPFGAGTTLGGLGGAYRGYTHDRHEPILGAITQGMVGAAGGGILGALAGRAFRP